MDKKLRLIAASIIVDSNLSKAAKQQMLNFIKEEATDVQVKALMLDGKIVRLDEQAEQIVNDRFEALSEDPLVAAGMALAPFFIALVGQMVKSFKRRMTAGGSTCRKFKGAEYNKCMGKYQLDGEMEKMKVLKQAVSKCNQTKDPAKCHLKISKMIARQKRKIDKTKERTARSRRSFGHGKIFG